MSVSTHLAIDLDEYDARIRTFIPDYDEMLEVTAAVVVRNRPKDVVDLGTGTGALAAAILARAPRTRITGIDEDAGMLNMAARRLPRRASFVHQSFLTAHLPACDAVVASFALHHVESRRTKGSLYLRMRKALRQSGVVVSADCHPASVSTLATDGMHAWRDHLARCYGRRKAAAFLRAWAHEDFYTPLDVELELAKSAGFDVDVAWRRGAFAVVVCKRRD